MIVLKTLARDYDIDPYKLRALLRSNFPKSPNRRWKWLDETNPELKMIRKFLSTYTSSTGASAVDCLTTPSRSPQTSPEPTAEKTDS